MRFADDKMIKRRLKLLDEQRESRIRKLIERGLIESPEDIPEDAIPVDPDRSSQSELYLPPVFYTDHEFECRDCGSKETWHAVTQQYYYEVLNGSPRSGAVRCPRCQGKKKRGITK
jgi:hypothetical protein